MNKTVAHSTAKDILKSGIYWDSSEALLPFYSENALSAIECISDLTSLEFIYSGLVDLLQDYGYEDFDHNCLDAASIEHYNRNHTAGQYFATHHEFMEFEEEMKAEFEYADEQEALFDIEFSLGASHASSIIADEIIIGIVFMSFIKFGKLTHELIHVAKRAVEREMLEQSLLKFPEDVRFQRRKELQILLDDLCRISG